MIYENADKVCDTLTPAHGESKAKGAHLSPYTLAQSHQDYNGGDRIKGAIPMTTNNSLIDFQDLYSMIILWNLALSLSLFF